MRSVGRPNGKYPTLAIAGGSGARSAIICDSLFLKTAMGRYGSLGFRSVYGS